MLRPRYIVRGMRPKIHLLTPVIFSAARQPSYLEKCLAIQAAHLAAYWPLNEAAGTAIEDHSGNGCDGVYVNAPAMGETGIGDGLTAVKLNGTDEYGNLYSAALRDAFNGNEGTLAIWGKVSDAAVWTDGNYHVLFELGSSGGNWVILYKGSTNNELAAYWLGGETELVVTSSSETGWFHLALTWSKSADEVKMYYNGVQQGTTQTGLGTWGSTLESGYCNLGCYQGPLFHWSGWLAHAAAWNTPLAASEIEELAKI